MMFSCVRPGPHARLFRFVFISLFGLGLILNEAIAQSPDATVDLGLRFATGHTDNVLLSNANQRSSSYRALGFNVTARREGPRMRGDINGDVEVRDYSASGVGNERVGSLNGFAEVDLVADVFTWDFDLNYGQGRIDPFRAAGPRNRQDVTQFATGPRVNLRLGSRTFMRMSLTESSRDFSNTRQVDSDSSGRELGFFRTLSPTTEVGLSWTSREISYDSTAFDWETDSVSASYRRQLTSGQASVSVGKSTTEYLSLSQDSPLVAVSWTRDIGARSRFYFSANRRQADTGDRFYYANVLSNPAAIGAANVLLDFGVYDVTDLSANNVFTYDRTRISISIGTSKSKIEQDRSRNFDGDYLLINANRDITSRMTVGIVARVFQRSFASRPLTDRDESYQMWLSQRFGRRLSFRVSGARNSRDGFSPYDETTYFVSLQLDLNP